MARTDHHAPSSPDFDPTKYDCYGVFHLEEPGCGREYQLQTKLLRERGFHCGRGSSGTCGHCGAHMSYFALMVREESQEYIHVGETCLDNRFGLETAEQFQKLRVTRRLNRERATRNERLEKLLDENPELRRLVLEPQEILETTGFLKSIRDKMIENARLSEAQIGLIKRHYASLARKEQWKEERQQRAALLASQGIQAPEGRLQVEGTVLSSKIQASDYGVVTKIAVRDDSGWTLWVTLPSNLEKENIKGRRIRLTATLERSKQDPAFAFGKRPSKGEFVEPGTT
jgi:hypothetical protein